MRQGLSALLIAFPFYWMVISTIRPEQERSTSARSWLKGVTYFPAGWGRPNTPNTPDLTSGETFVIIYPQMMTTSTGLSWRRRA